MGPGGPGVNGTGGGGGNVVNGGERSGSGTSAGGATYYDYSNGTATAGGGGAGGAAAFHHHHHHRGDGGHNPGGAPMGNSPLLREAYTGRSGTLEPPLLNDWNPLESLRISWSLLEQAGSGGIHWNPSESIRINRNPSKLESEINWIN